MAYHLYVQEWLYGLMLTTTDRCYMPVGDEPYGYQEGTIGR